MDETIAFFTSAFEGVSVDDVRSLVAAHTNARGETDTEAVMAGLESLAAPKINASKNRELKIERQTAAVSSGPLKMTLKPIMDGGCIGTINVNADLLATFSSSRRTEPPAFMVLIDRSGSMGSSFERLFNRILPAVVRKLKIPKDERITIVAFDHTIRTHILTCSEMQSLRVYSGGRTYMAPGVRAIADAILAQPERPIRLLVLTDGALNDQDETCVEASRLAGELRGKFRINSQAFRFYTSSSEPDTRGVCACLALNTVSESQLIDLSAAQSESVLVDSIFDAFDGDGLDMTAEIEADDAILTANPWDAQPQKTLALKPGLNYVWFKKAPRDLKIKGTSVAVDFELSNAAVSLEDISGTLKPLMDSYVTRLKVLKVVNTPATITEMKSILEYFERFENFLQQGAVTLTDLAQNHGIRHRIEYFRQMAARRRQSLYGMMCEVANNEKVAQLSAAQQADYLRTVEGKNKNAKALARRAMGSGLDFGGTLHKEVRDMKAHISEIEGIDDSQHAVSFYSMESTLGGIKALCSFDDEALEMMEATDLIQIANIVGVPCAASIGNFADPMCYRVDRMLTSGAFLSLSDILVAHVQSKGKALTAPGFPDVEITNVIPVFDDPRIQRFLQRYAPSLLSYTASIGMRRIIADVEGTYAYTIAAGVWKMIEVLSENPSEGNISLFVRFSHDFHQAIHGNFNYVVDMIGDKGVVAKHSDDPSLSFFINNNGITNMIDPILQVTNPKMMMMASTVKKDPEEIAACAMGNMPRILRNIYSFEVYQAVRRIFKKEDDPEPFIQKTLHDLLGIDLAKNATALQPLFEAEPKPEERKHFDQYMINDKAFDEIIKGMWYVDYLVLLPSALGAVSKDSPVSYIRENFRPLSAQVACEALGLDLLENGDDGGDAEATLRRFKICNIVQGFLAPSKADRVDADAKKMKIADLGFPTFASKQDSFLRTYVAAQFANQYRKDCVEKLKQEKKQVVTELLREMVHTTSIDTFCSLLLNGRTRANVSDVVKDVSHIGFVPLKKALQDLSHDVPLRLRKLAVLVLAHDENDEPVFNGGNVVVKGIDEVEETFLNLGENNQLEQLHLRYRQFMKHNYRESGVPNRHTHCSDKVSYFGLGFATLDEFAKAVSAKEFKEYCRLHWCCCGIPQARGAITRRSQRRTLEPPADAKFAPSDPRYKKNDNNDDE